MKKEKQVEARILSILQKNPSKGIPKKTVEEELKEDFTPAAIEASIWELLENYIVDLVSDYPSEDSDLYCGHRVWHLKLLTPEEGQILRDLSPVKCALLRIVRKADSSNYPGTVRVDDASAVLRSEGFLDDEIRWLSIEGMVERVSTTVFGDSAKCYRIIPEDEKTEEYKRAMEEMHEAATRKEIFYMYIADTHDLAHGILEAVRAAPEGISKKDIIGQLFRSDPDYLKEAFAIATEENEILPITLENGEDGYRINPEFYEEDW